MARLFPFHHLLSLCPRPDREERGFPMAQTLRTLGSEGEQCRGVCCKALLIAYICHTPGSNPAFSDTGSAHTTHVILYMQTPLCSRSLTHWHPLPLAMQRGGFHFHLLRLRLSRDSLRGLWDQPKPRGLCGGTTKTMISLPPLQCTRGSPAQPATAVLQLASLPSQPACSHLTSSSGPDLACKQERKGKERREQTGSNSLLLPSSQSSPHWMERRKEVAKGR